MKPTGASATSMANTIRLTGTLICSSEAERALVRQFLPEHIRLTRQEPGCLSFEVTQSADPLIWTVEECFTDQAAFDAHQTRTKASEWARQTAAIRRDYRIIAADRS
jgi:quinol monooxygenase YgiN